MFELKLLIFLCVSVLFTVSWRHSRSPSATSTSSRWLHRLHSVNHKHRLDIEPTGRSHGHSGPSPSTLPNPEEVTTMLLDKILKQAANLVVANLKNDSSANSTIAASKPLFFNLPLSFASHYSKKLIFNHTKPALQYLSLPARNYSVLNSTVVSKSPHDDSTFLIRLPLRDFASALDSISPQLNYRVLGKYILATSIAVDPQPEGGRIVMTSGPFFFLPDDDAAGGTGTTSSSTDAVSIQNIIARDILPTWLVWGGGSNASAVSSNTTTASLDVTNNAAGDGQEGNTSFAHSADSSAGIKSSLQPTLSVEMKWDPQAETHKARSSNNQLDQWNRAIQSWWKTNIDRKTITSEDDVLSVRLKVVVKMDMNVPLPYGVGKALHLLPVKVLMQQAGSLVISTFLHNLVPPFTKLLLRDYERRNNGTSSQPSL